MPTGIANILKKKCISLIEEVNTGCTSMIKLNNVVFNNHHPEAAIA